MNSGSRLSMQLRGGWGSLWTVALVGIPRMAYLLVHPPALPSVYWALSDSVLRDGSLAIDGQKMTDFEPLYPIFLAVSRVVTADHALLVQLLQIAISVVGGLCLFRLAQVLTGRRRVALIAVLLYALDPLLIRASVSYTETTLFTTLLIGFCATVVETTTWTAAALAGCWLGLTILTRTSALPLLVLAPAVPWLRRKHRVALAMGVVAVVIVLPLPLRNHRVNGSLWPTRSGTNLYIANCRYTSALLPEYDLDVLEQEASTLIEAHLPNADALSPPAYQVAVDGLLTRESLRYMSEHPSETLGQKLLNVVYFFSPLVVPFRESTADSRVVVTPSGAIAVAPSRARPLLEVLTYGAWTSVVLICSVAGLWFRRGTLPADAILWCVAVTIVAVSVVYVPATRYRAPMEFVLLFYAAAALDRWGEELTHGRTMTKAVPGTSMISVNSQ
jgi:hypothetical protein